MVERREGQDSRRATLVGVATGRPDGGVAILRLSGPAARRIGERLVGELPAARRLGRRRIALANGQHEDGLVVWMPGPKSFTGEDVVELHVHAGVRNVEAVVAACREAGAAAAGAGDFTRRAFELGTLGLDQAEGIAAVIGAQTEAALEQARRLAAGELGRTVEAEAERVGDLRAEIEANLDFPEDVSAGDEARWRREIETRRDAVARWLAGFERGRRARSVPRVVLAGPPNAGKSSLFNALVGKQRAIVSDLPGTTRDYVEQLVEIGSHACVLVDTAGLRQSEDEIEAVGVAYSADQVAGADVVIWAEASDATPVERLGSSAEVILVETKRDLGTQRPGWHGIARGDGVEGLRRKLKAWFAAGNEDAWIGLARHRERAEQSKEALDAAGRQLADGAPLEVVAFELGVAQGRLGEITGRTTLGPVGEDVLARVFSKFCIGK